MNTRNVVPWPKQPPRAVAAEVILLQLYRSTVRPFNVFGNSNRDAIQAQIDVLQSNMTGEKIEDEWGMEGEDPCEHTYDSANYARRWLDGEEQDSPSKDWKPLLMVESPAEPKPKKKK